MRAIQDPASAAEFAAAVTRRHLPDSAYRIFLFGSCAAGSAAERSDIDIDIEGLAPVPRPARGAIHDEIEDMPTLYTIDMFDSPACDQILVAADSRRPRSRVW